MKILAICGSPRRGNSYSILNSVKEKYPDVGEADYQFYKDKTDFVYDTKINFLKKMLAKMAAGKVIKKMDEE